jgi:hypothetical protein
MTMQRQKRLGWRKCIAQMNESDSGRGVGHSRSRLAKPPPTNALVPSARVGGAAPGITADAQLQEAWRPQALYLLHRRRPVFVCDWRLSAEEREVPAELVGRRPFCIGLDRLYNTLSHLTAAAMREGVPT